MRRTAGKALVIVWKDIVSEFRTRDIVASVFVFALLVLIVFNFAIEPGAQTAKLVAPGVLWVAITFAGVLGLNRSFVLEKEKGCLEGLMLCPVPREVIYLGKMLSILLFMFAVEVVLLPVFSIFFNQPIFMPKLLVVAFLASLGIAAVGTLFSAIAVSTKTRELMLPLLFFPVIVPVLIAAVEASALVLAQEPWGALRSWLQMLAAFDIIFLVVPLFIFEFVIEE